MKKQSVKPSTVPDKITGTALDPNIRFADLIVDDQTYKLAYSFKSMRIAEPMTGINMLQGLLSLYSGISATQLGALFFASLIIAQPDITLDQAFDLIRPDTLLDVLAKITEAYELSKPPAKKKTGEDEPKPEVANP